MKWQLASMTILFFIAPVIIFATSQSDLEREIEKVSREREILVEEQKKLEVELDTLNKEAKTLGTAVKSLDVTRKKLTKDISITQSKINSTNLTIKSLENNIGDKEKQITIHKQAILSAIGTLFEYDSRSLVLSVLSSIRLSDLWRDESQLGELNHRLSEEIDALRKVRESLNLQKTEKEKVKEEQLSLKGQLSGQKSVVEENKKVKENLLIKTKNKEAEYQKLLEANIANQRQFEEDLYRLESELRISIDPSLIPTSRPGVLFWPLDKILITQHFGRTSASSRLYASGTHNGVDFRAIQGTSVKAVLSGVVKGTGNTDEQRGCGSYGRWVLLEHSNGLSSVYAHLSATIVKTGQSVKTGEIIGYSGGMPGVYGSGYSTGPHLHLGLFASQGVQIRQFTSSKNCKQVFVPVADLKAYLDPLAYLPSL